MIKRGVFFSTDALLALAVILVGILIIYPYQSVSPVPRYTQQDFVSSLSYLEVGSMNSSLIASYFASGSIRDPDRSVLAQIGEFYIQNQSMARELAEEAFSTITSIDNIGIWFGDALIASKNSSPIETAKNILTDRQIISGIQEGESVTAFSARAFIGNSLKTKYYYFGGYVGEGNISTRVEYYGNISSATMEIATSKNFEVFVNNVSAGSFSGSASPFIPKTISIPTTDFSDGENTVEIRGDTLNIAGGFVKISYLEDMVDHTVQRYYFPGITGVINLYDGFYVPGEITSLDIFLHLDANLSSFLNIGNVTVYTGSTAGEESITINDSYLSSLLDYTSLGGQTVPIRLGLENVTYITNYTRSVDVYSVTDLSGSMNPSCSGGGFLCCLFSGNFCGSQSTCSNCGGVYEDKLSAAKQANYNFIDSLLNDTEGSLTNRIGLAGYKTSVSLSDTHALSSDNESLISEVSSWTAGGSTCICCGINYAANDLVANADPDSFQSIVVMSDGEANIECPQQNTGNAKTDAIQASCDAAANGFTVYAVGFGNEADEATLQSIAACGNGTYYYASVANLAEIYENIASEIIEGAFFEQTLVLEGEYQSKLYPDSYISFTYNATTPPFGIIATAEKLFTDSWGGSFDLPPNSTLVEAAVISYSGPRWTTEVIVNGQEAYNLSKYNLEFTELGDPYSIHLPNALIGTNNTVQLSTGLSSLNLTEGSIYNKIIYTVARENVAAYSELSGSAEGCLWDIEFETLNITNLAIPEEYGESEVCTYTANSRAIADSNDAIQVAVFSLLELLDFNLDGILDVSFNEEDLQITSSTLTGIPYSWSTEIQVRSWT